MCKEFEELVRRVEGFGNEMREYTGGRVSNEMREYRGERVGNEMRE